MEKIEEVTIKKVDDDIITEYTPNSKHIEKCIQNHEPICTNTAAFMRLPIFPAVQPKKKKLSIETCWGQVIVENPASQRHLDLLECIFYLANHIDTKGNRIVVLVDEYQLRKKLSKTGERISQERLAQMIKNLEDVKLITKHIISSNGQQVKVEMRGRIIDRTTTIEGKAKNKKKKTIIEFTFGDMVSADLWIDKLFLYDPEKIVKLKHSYTKAIARFLLSHETEKEKKWKLLNVLEYLGIYIKSSEEEEEEGKIYISRDQYRQIVQRIKEDLPVLSELGITLKKKDNEYYLICAPNTHQSKTKR